MNDALERAFSDYVRLAAAAHPCLSAMHYYTAGQPGTAGQPVTSEGGEDFVLPSASFEVVETETLHANTAVSTSTLVVLLETQADDEAEDTHIARGNAVVAILRPHRQVSAFITASTAPVRVYGYSLGMVTRELKERRWTTAIHLEVGYRLTTAA